MGCVWKAFWMQGGSTDAGEDRRTGENGKWAQTTRYEPAGVARAKSQTGAMASQATLSEAFAKRTEIMV